VCKNGPKGAHRRTKVKKSHNLSRPFGQARWHFGPCHHRWWNMGLPIRPWNEAAKCTMEDCQFPTTKKVPSVQIKSQKMLLTFFYIRGIVHYEFVPTGQTVNQVYYLEVLEKLCEKIRQKWSKHFANNSWILHQDNAPAHTALSVREFLATKQIPVLEQPAHSLDLAPGDFFLFPKIKEILKGRHFDDTDDIWSNTTAALKTIPQNQFQNCFDGWTRCWHWCIASQGDYFEGERVVFSNEVCSTFTTMSSRTLLSDHVYNIISYGLGVL